jgi:hypothetical protein
MSGVLAAVCSFGWVVAAHAASPDAALVGTWHGTLEDYRIPEDHGRELVINRDGTCLWGFPGKAGKATCDYGPNGLVKVTTGAQRPSKVELSLKEGRLTGAFTLYQANGFYKISMTR